MISQESCTLVLSTSIMVYLKCTKKAPPWLYTHKEGTPLAIRPQRRHPLGYTPTKKAPPWLYAHKEGTPLAIRPQRRHPLGYTPTKKAPPWLYAHKEGTPLAIRPIVAFYNSPRQTAVIISSMSLNSFGVNVKNKENKI